MAPEYFPLITYILITTFTPGPNNISSAAAGVRLGLKKSLPYLFGMATGFFVVLLLSGYLNFFLHEKYAAIAVYIKWIGFLYMLWLAASLFLKNDKKKTAINSFSFVPGVLLQLVNPKVILYGITIFAAFSNILAVNSWTVFASSIGLSCVGFLSVLTWCLAGSSLTRFLDDKRNLLVFNLVLAGLLLYSAFSIILE